MSNRAHFLEDAKLMTTQQMVAKMAFANAVSGPSPKDMDEDKPERVIEGSAAEERLDPDKVRLRQKSGFYKSNQHRTDENPNDPNSNAAQQRATSQMSSFARSIANSSVTLGNGISLSFKQVETHFDTVREAAVKKEEENKQSVYDGPRQLAIGPNGMPIRTDEELKEWMKTQPAVYREGYWVSMETMGFDKNGEIIDRRDVYAAHTANQQNDALIARVEDVQTRLESGELKLEDLAKTDPDMFELLERLEKGEEVLLKAADSNPEGYVIPDPKMIIMNEAIYNNGTFDFSAQNIVAVDTVTYDESVKEILPAPYAQSPDAPAIQAATPAPLMSLRLNPDF